MSLYSNYNSSSTEIKFSISGPGNLSLKLSYKLMGYKALGKSINFSMSQSLL